MITAIKSTLILKHNKRKFIQITKVTQTNTGMYTEESSQETFKILNVRFDVRFEKAYQIHNNKTIQTRKKNKISRKL